MKRRWIAASLVVAALLALWLWPKQHASAPTAEPREAESASANLGEAIPMQPIVESPPAIASSRASAPDGGGEPPPVIDSITVEKPEVCEGEENLVTVRAHTVNGTDEFLHYYVGTQIGESVPVRLYGDGHGGHYDRPMVSVFGRNNVATRVPVPAYTVKPCKELTSVVLEARVNANTTSEFTISARIVQYSSPDDPRHEHLPPQFRPVSFAWTFGDGTTDKTSVPWTTHSYENRKQSDVYSQFVLGVEVADADGKKVVGRQALELLNPATETFKVKGVVQLLFTMDPRFPVADSSGVVREHVRLFHQRDVSVTLERGMLTRSYVGGVGEAPPETITAASVLGRTDIPPGPGIEFDLTLDTHDRDLFGLTYRFEGKSDDGYPAYAMFSILRPPDKPTKENSDPITSAVLLAKIKLARELLGRDTVNDEDLWQLEREGKFDAIKADPSLKAAAANQEPPKNLPKPAVDPARMGGPAPNATAPPEGNPAPAPTERRPPTGR